MAAGVKYYKCSLELYKKYSKENRLQDLSFYFTEDKNTKAKALYLGKLLLSDSGVNGNIDINALEATIKNLGNAIIELGTGIDAVNAEIDTVNNEIDQLWVEVDEINVAVQSKVNTETYEAYVSTINSAIEALNTELEETNNSIENKVSKETYDKGMEDLDVKYTEEVQDLWVALDDKVSKETYDKYTAARELTDEEIKEMKVTLEGQLSDKVSQNEYSTYIQDRKLTDKGIQTLVDNISQTVSELSDVIDDKVSAKDYDDNLTIQAQVNTELQEQMGDLSESVKGLQEQTVSKDYVDGLIEELDKKIPIDSGEIIVADYEENDPTSEAYINNRPFYEEFQILEKKQEINIPTDLRFGYSGMLEEKERYATALDFFNDWYYNAPQNAPKGNNTADFNAEMEDYMTGYIPYEKQGDLFEFYQLNLRKGFEIRREPNPLTANLYQWPKGTYLIFNDGKKTVSIEDKEFKQYVKKAECYYVSFEEGTDAMNPIKEIYTYERKWCVHSSVLKIVFPEKKEKKIKTIDSGYIDPTLTARVEELEKMLAKVLPLVEETTESGGKKPVQVREFEVCLSDAEAVAYRATVKKRNPQITDAEIEEEVKTPVKGKSWWEKAVSKVSDIVENTIDDTKDFIKDAIKLADTAISIMNGDTKIALTNLTGDWHWTGSWDDNGFMYHTFTFHFTVNGVPCQRTIDVTGTEVVEVALSVAIKLLLKEIGGEIISEIVDKVD